MLEEKRMDSFWKKPLRIVQNNLRGSDAKRINVEELMRTQAEYGTNAIIANAGGLMCWYDSRISRQPKNPDLTYDYVKEVIHYAHQYGMKVLLRLDISNVSQQDLKDHPDWLRRDAEGNIVYDLGMPQSCFFSPMWQEYNFQLIDELMTEYKPDGLFYNAVHFGFCHCEKCKAHYRKATGHEMPDRLLVNTEEGREYMQYRYREMAAYLARVRDAIHRYNPDAVLAPVGNFCTENPCFNSLSGWDASMICDAEDVQVSETVTHLMRPQPYWVYLPGENASGTNAIGKPAMMCIHQACQLGRNAVTAPAQYVFDIAQAALHGGGPTINMIGTFDQEDKKDLLPLKKIFHFLRDNEDCLTDFRARNHVALVYSQKTNDFDARDDQTAFSPSALYRLPPSGIPYNCGNEYRGVYEALVHQHIPFDVLHDGYLTKVDLSRYEFLILPGVTCLSDDQRDAVDAFVKMGGRLILTGALPTRDGEGREKGARLQCLPFDIEHAKPTNGYLMLENRALYPSMPDTGLIGIGFCMSRVTPGAIPGLIRDMRRREAPKNNKPEFSDIAEMTDEYGLYLYPCEKGQVLVLPWSLGEMYRRYGIYECPKVLKDLMRRMGLTEDVKTDAPYTVEIIPGTSEAGETLSLINGTGFSGKAVLECIPLSDLHFAYRTKASKAESRANGIEYPGRREGEFLSFTVPRLDLYDVLVLKGE